MDRTGRAITQNFTEILFTPPPATAPVFLGQMQTAYGKNPADLQWRDKDAAGVELRIAEETSYDAEIQHNPEVVGYTTWFLRGSRSPGGSGCESVLKPLADLYT